MVGDMARLIYDPKSPTPIFDGMLDVFTTCRACGTLMKVIVPGEHSHPCCYTVETELESLAQLLDMEMRAEDWQQAALTRDLMEAAKTLSIAAAASMYADWHWPVFPLGMRAKEPAIPKARGGNGFKDATFDRKRIDKYWDRHPDHNIGLATGAAFDVIDVDTKDSSGKPSSAGVMSLMKLLDDRELPECHGIAVTASGGMHLYVKPTGKGCFAGLRPGIDYRGRGGYVVAPPSRLHGAGRTYTWMVEPSPVIKGG